MGEQPMHTALPSHGRPPPFYAQPMSRKSLEMRPDMMELETERSQRAGSVLSGLSADDIQAAETLKSLQQQDMHSPRIQQSTPPQHVQITTSFNDNEPEPLLSLITSQYPLAASVINGSIGIYKAAQVYTPGGEYIERTVGLPLARKTARISGVESVARWALQPKREGYRDIPSTPDIEKAFIQLGPDGVIRRAENGEQLPPYNAGDRSPPYSEASVLLHRDQPSQVGWGQQLIITTSGLGVAMSDESIKSLTYCLQCLRWANGRLGGAVTNLKDLLEQWERRGRGSRSMSVSSLTSNGNEESVLAARIAAVKADVLSTLQRVVSIVSTYAGGALPENARRLVHQHLVTLPQRFTIAARRSSEDDNYDVAASNANKALVLAQEGLDMMNQVSRVVNDTLQSAESWLEKLGRRRPGTATQQHGAAMPEKRDPSHEQDTKMEL